MHVYILCKSRAHSRLFCHSLSEIGDLGRVIGRLAGSDCHLHEVDEYGRYVRILHVMVIGHLTGGFPTGFLALERMHVSG